MTVKLIHCDGRVTYLAFDYEGDEAFAAYSDFCGAKEFGSLTEIEDAVSIAKFQGLKFCSYQAVAI